MAAGGRLVLDRASRRVDLVLVNGTRYSTTKEGETDTFRFPAEQIMSLDADTVFGRMELPRGRHARRRSPSCGRRIEEKRRASISPHPEIMGIQIKFSIPVACFVFALIGLALGVTVARDGKLAGFVLGIAVIFAYYVVMFLAESYTKGLYPTPSRPTTGSCSPTPPAGCRTWSWGSSGSRRSSGVPALPNAGSRWPFPSACRACRIGGAAARRLVTPPPPGRHERRSAAAPGRHRR